jgi:putative phage-type endonuclease
MEEEKDTVEYKEVEVENEIEQVDVPLSEDEYIEFETTVLEMIYDELDDNCLSYSDPDFRANLVEDICDFFHDEWYDADLLKDNEHMYNHISQIVDSFFAIYENEFPERSSLDSYVFTKSDAAQMEAQIEYLRNLPQPKQKSVEWHQYRHQLMTASNIWKALSTDSQRNSLIYEKCKPLNPFAAEKGNWHAGGSLQWGVLYEDVTLMIYEKKYNTKVADFGCIQHQTHKCIGASPDGINVDPASDRYGRMVEVKNIVNRDITGTPKEDYWIQMQVQMETCQLSECDFIETRFKEYETESDYFNDVHQEWKGIILCFIERNVPNSKPTYKYMPLDLPAHEAKDWIAATKDELKETLVLYTTTYWYLDELSCVLVKRNERWFNAALPKILDTWDTILRERETGYEHRAAKKRNPSTSINVTCNTDEYTITNLKIVPSLCLVKLDHE